MLRCRPNSILLYRFIINLFDLLVVADYTHIELILKVSVKASVFQTRRSKAIPFSLSLLVSILKSKLESLDFSLFTFLNIFRIIWPYFQFTRKN
jgi:hypothetical protein